MTSPKGTCLEKTAYSQHRVGLSRLVLVRGSKNLIAQLVRQLPLILLKEKLAMGGLISSDDEAKKVRKKKTSPASPSFDPDAISEVSGSSGSEPATPGNVGRASSFTPTQATQNATKTLFSQYSGSP